MMAMSVCGRLMELECDVRAGGVEAKRLQFQGCWPIIINGPIP